MHAYAHRAFRRAGACVLRPFVAKIAARRYNGCMKKRTIVFDFDMTLGYRSPMWTETVRLLLLRHNVFSTDEQVIPITHGDVYPWHFDGAARAEFLRGKTWWQAVGGAIADELVLRGVCSRAVADAVAKELPGLFCDLRFWELFPDTLPTLTALKDEGHTLVLLTNHIPEARRIFEHLGILPLFDRAVISSEQDVEKPDPRIWDLALDGFERDGAVMIGDNYSTDIKGALACGLQAILVRKPNDADYPLYSPTLEGIIPVLRQL